MEENTKLSGLLNKSSLLPAGIAGAVAFVIGVIFGLVVLGWWLWPVQWVDASPADLQKDYQVSYLQMAIEAYALTGDATTAQQRFAALGENGPALLETLAKNPPLQLDAFIIGEFAQAVGQADLANSMGLPMQEATPAAGAETTPEAAAGGETPASATPAASAPSPTPETTQKSRSTFRVISLLCGVSLLALILAAGLFLLRSRRKSKAPVTPAQRARAATEAAAAQASNYEAEGREPPLSQFMTTYVHGDDLFDDSFSIDAPTGEFLGECGVGITDTIGVGEPKRVMAFEVWLFDKNDIQTITKVLMSEHAYNDEATRQRLAAKGDPVMARPGEEIVLETEKLQLVARVVDMAYGEDALPANSYFERLTLELAVWPKE